MQSEMQKELQKELQKEMPIKTARKKERARGQYAWSRVLSKERDHRSVPMVSRAMPRKKVSVFVTDC